ncbi:elongation factor Ts [Patescibacteria group bacterium]|nr:elongation factor Ts [Patescibacteria group bacterium]
MKDKIKELREKTGASIIECQKAYKETKDIVKAIDLLRKKGQKIADKKAHRQTSEGVIEAYIHANRKVGSLVELSCETDFVARNEEFINLAHDIAMQVAAADPKYLSEQDVPKDVIKKEKEVYQEQLKAEKKPANIQKKIIEGKLQKFYQQECLTRQQFIKDDSKIIDQLVREAIAKLGENIQIKRFVCFSL